MTVHVYLCMHLSRVWGKWWIWRMCHTNKQVKLLNIPLYICQIHVCKVVALATLYHHRNHRLSPVNAAIFASSCSNTAHSSANYDTLNTPPPPSKVCTCIWMSMCGSAWQWGTAGFFFCFFVFFHWAINSFCMLCMSVPIDLTGEHITGRCAYICICKFSGNQDINKLNVQMQSRWTQSNVWACGPNCLCMRVRGKKTASAPASLNLKQKAEQLSGTE